MNTLSVCVGDVLEIKEAITFRDRSFVGKEKTITIQPGGRLLVRRVDIQDPNKAAIATRPEPCAEVVVVSSKDRALLNNDHIQFIIKNDKGVIVKNILK